MIYIYFFPFFSFCKYVYYASACDFVCITLLLSFVLEFSLSVFFKAKNCLNNYF